MRRHLQRFKYLEQELRTKDASHTSTEESTPSQSPLGEIKTPARKRGRKIYCLKGGKNLKYSEHPSCIILFISSLPADKREVKSTCTKNDSTKTKPSQPASPRLRTSSSAQLSTLPQNDNMLQLEERLQKKHHIVPCSIRLTR